MIIIVKIIFIRTGFFAGEFTLTSYPEPGWSCDSLLPGFHNVERGASP